MNKSAGDKVSVFIKRHSGRFDYLTFELLDSISSDDVHKSANNRLCSLLSNDDFYKHFLLLTPAMKGSEYPATRFTIKEMMLVASRFFYVHSLNKKDTTLNAHVCAGFNGQKELKEKDYTVLAAFCFEGIFKNLYKKNFTPWANFTEKITKYSAYEKTKFANYESYVQNVRQLCYNDYEKDEILQRTLLNYYQKNKNNIGFIIE
jgi:hypothetical protein